MAQACARLCHQLRHLLNDVGGNGESGGGGESVVRVSRGINEAPPPLKVATGDW